MSKELMKLALEALEMCEVPWTGTLDHNLTEAITALREELAKPDFWEGYVPEPVKPAPVREDWGPGPHEYHSLPAQQEPVAWIVEDQIGERLEWASDAHSCHGVPTFPLYTTPPAQRKPLTDERIESVRHMRDVQGYDGNWNYDPYMQGLYNGLEFALSLLEVRQPEFKDAPATWLSDIKFKRDKLSREAAHGIKENT